jgi:biofilm PGA synthesis N-glycosyltransferase PgaC
VRVEYFESLGLFVVGLYLFYIFVNAVALISSKKHKESTDQIAATILVPFRNEKETLANLVASFESLSYPKDLIEIILINDHSDDGSELYDFSNSFLNIRIIHAKGEGKKNAITEGIAKASNEIIVQTDADCEVPEYWLNYLLAPFPEKDMVCGSVVFSNSQLQNSEILSYQGIGKAANHMRTPFLCNAANMAYRKSTFQDLGGFNDNISISSGDDVYLLRSFSKAKKEIAYTLNEKCCVKTKAERSPGKYLKQRVRWASKTKKGQSFDVVLAGIVVFLTNVFVLFEIALNVIQGVEMGIGLIAVLSKFAIDFLFLFLVAQRMKKYLPLLSFPIASIWYSLYIVLIVILSGFYRPKWKNRKIQI